MLDPTSYRDQRPQSQGGPIVHAVGSRITHIAIEMTDIAATLDFYVGQLGLREMFRLDRAGKFWIVYLRVVTRNTLKSFPVGEGVAYRGRKRQDTIIGVSRCPISRVLQKNSQRPA